MYEFDDFEWDEAKAETNFAKHGFDFNNAWQVFADPMAKTLVSPQNEELRYRTIGICEGKLASVVHTERNGNCRIISMRHVWDSERKTYYGDSTKNF